jgi:ABC-type transport system involved in multi-copper enzyme maturation permease subunit
MRRILIAYEVELAKAMRHKPTYAGPLLVVLAVLLTAVQRPPMSDGRSDYTYIALATAQALHGVGLVMILVYVAGLIAGEVRDGSIRSMLTRPLLRHEYVIAKLMHALTYTAVLTVVCGLSAWAVAFYMGDLIGVSFGGDLLHPGSGMLTAYLGGAALALVTLGAAASYALFMSALIPRPMLAACAAVAGWFALEFLKYPLGIEAALFSTYVESPWAVFVGRAEGLPAAWGLALRACLTTSLPALVLFTAGAALLMRNRNLG